MAQTKNRWLIAASACSINVSIGSIYAYSVWKMPLENTFGWSSSNTSMAFSLAIFSLGLTAAFLGRLIVKNGARFGGLLAALFFSAGLFGAALACQTESLPLFYLCFGLVSGIGLGLGYISPISTLVKWFPDRRGLATGLAIMGFGFGGLICAKLIDQFVPVQSEIVLQKEASPYEFIHHNSDTTEKTHVLPTLSTFKAQTERLSELQKAQQTDSQEYSTLVSQTAPYKTSLLYNKQSIVRAFIYLGIIYFCIMIPSACYITPPLAGYDVERAGMKDSATKLDQAGEMSVTQAIRRPGFYGLWLMLFLNASCGIALISTAKKMGYEMVHLPDGMASLLVMGISLFNGLGRIGWAAFSDVIGRPNTFIIFFVIQVIAFPLLASLAGSPIAFMAVTFLILSCYGGGFATIPTYISDLFGLKSMPTLLGIILTAWSCAGLVGPMLNAYIYEQSQNYQSSLYAFTGLIALALLISVLMRFEIKKIYHHYSSAEVEATRAHNHGI
jgi:OFA family oxalate/formate antiporter-like MFS transporter